MNETTWEKRCNSLLDELGRVNARANSEYVRRKEAEWTLAAIAVELDIQPLPEFPLTDLTAVGLFDSIVEKCRFPQPPEPEWFTHVSY